MIGRRQTPDRALSELAREFPDIPARIVAAVLDAYLARGGSVTAALTAARGRLADACAA